jgi:endonuclease YncB( thermonuclease family)
MNLHWAGILFVFVAFMVAGTTTQVARSQNTLEAYLILRGAFVIIGKQPDGDSIRFRPDRPELLQKLKRANRIEPSKYGTVQLRLEGIDAPELHYENLEQPFSKEPRDELIKWFGFTNVTFTPKGVQVKTSSPKEIRGAILAQAAEVYGRPVSYALREADAATLEDGARIAVSTDLLTRTINAHMLETGMAYYTVYSSQPVEHRAAFRAITENARSKGLGVWEIDSKNGFTLSTLEDVTEKQLILPKLFRRAVVYFQDREKGFTGTFADWFVAYANRDDRLFVPTRAPGGLGPLEVNGRRTKLSSILEVTGEDVVLLVDFLDVVLDED